MSRPVATVNGVPVYSDKGIASIVNCKITFNDGSWCNVQTGEVVNNGPGYIKLGSSPGSVKGEKTTVDPREFETTELSVSNVDADVEIQPGDIDKMVVEVTGSKTAVEDIGVRQQGAELIISGKGSAGGGGGNVVMTGSGSVSISGGGVVISGAMGRGRTTIVTGGGNTESDVKIKITVPSGSPINISGVNGLATIGDVDGPLRAAVLGGSDINAGRVKDAELNVQGSGDIRVQEANGNLSASVQGSGDISVKRGQVTYLNASVMGSGDIKFSGRAQDANLSVMGRGDIYAHHVVNKPSMSIMGRGNIEVGNW